MTSPETVALYARVSTDNQNIDPQIKKLTDWAEYRDYEYEVFKDDGVSAVADDRPGFDYLMERIDEFDAVAFTNLDRFGRSLNQLSTWANDLNEEGIDIITTEQSIDTSTIEGELLFNILSVIADYERKLTRERMEAGFQQAKEEGRVGRPKKDLPLERIEQQYENGANVEYLANKYDVSRQTIYNRLEELGLLED